MEHGAGSAYMNVAHTNYNNVTCVDPQNLVVNRHPGQDNVHYQSTSTDKEASGSNLDDFQRWYPLLHVCSSTIHHGV